jgi:hypothetical protein
MPPDRPAKKEYPMPRNTSPSPWNNSKPALMLDAWSMACAPRPGHSARRGTASKPTHAPMSKRTHWPYVLAVFCVAVIVIMPLSSG